MTPAIRLENISKQYRIGARGSSYLSLRETLMETLAAPFRYITSVNRPPERVIWALDNVSGEIMPGEAVGLIGLNGAGKTTLLKILARITKPTSGRAELRGRVGSLLDVGTGFHPELTGRENIYLNGAILGMAQAEVRRQFDHIVDFSGVEQFLDTPLKHYSTGMRLRPAFAVAAHLDVEILLADEVLAVGDVAFQKKCIEVMGSLAQLPCEPLRATGNPLIHLRYLWKFPATVAAYRREIRRFRPDLFHVDSLFHLPALVAAKLAGVPSLLHLQEIPYGFVRGLLASLAGSLADRVVAVSQAAAAPMRGRVDPSRIAVVYNGTPLPDSVADYNPNGWVAFVGRLSEDKDPILFLRAAARVYTQQPNARFLICGLTVPGRERYEERLCRELQQSGLPPENVAVFRDRDDVADLLRETSMLVNCSAVPESFGLAVLEAMALAIPVVVPRSGAFPEYVTDRETGLLYAPGDLEELAASILRLLRDPPLARKIGLAGRALVERRFTEEQMASAMEEQYKQLLAGKDKSI